MNTLKWSKDEEFINTPEYETRKRALFDNHFGDPARPASLAGAKSLRKKTWTGSGEEDTSSGNSSASDEEKASSAGSKKKERSTQSKDTAKAKASRIKKRRFNKTSLVSDQMEEYCVTALWVHKADFTGEAVKLIIPYKYDRVACVSSSCVAQPGLHRFNDKNDKEVKQWLQGEDGTWNCAVCAKNRSKGSTFDPADNQRVATKMLHNTYRQHINNVIKVAKNEDEMVPIEWGPTHRKSDGGYLSVATQYTTNPPRGLPCGFPWSN